MNRYLIDANVLINFDIFTPIDYHQNFWDELTRHVELGNIVVLDSIANECKNPQLQNWIQKIKPHVVAIDDDIRQRAQAINSQYPMITVDQTRQMKSEADTHLIAHAKKHGLGVFTRESIRRSPKDPFKIPDVCKAVGVPCYRSPFHTMRNLAFAKCS